MPGSIDAGLRRRHMYCTYPLSASDCACIGCPHQSVHFELVNCKDRCENSGVRATYKCEPTLEANYG
jgi:hypothetical protein